MNRKYSQVRIGDQFGFWTVVELGLRNHHNQKVVKCQCICGNFRIMLPNFLHDGSTRSCGCRQFEGRTWAGQVKKDGQYGYLKVIETDLKKSNGAIAAKCICHCGKSILVACRALIKGQKSCGCMNKFKDYIGQRFGKLTIIKCIGVRSTTGRGVDKRRYWRAKCDCGNIWEGPTHKLNGGVRSCGCLAIEVAKNQIGPKHPQYRHDLSIKDRLIIRRRNLIPGYLQWQQYIQKLFEYKCCICNKNRNLECHHLDGFSKNIEKAIDPQNGVLLCGDCHKFFHKIYGIKDVTKIQFLEFYKNCTGNDIVL